MDGVAERSQRGLVERLAQRRMNMDCPGDVVEHRTHLDRVDEFARELGHVQPDGLYPDDAVVVAPGHRSDESAVGATFLLLGMVVGAFGPLLEHLTRRFGVSLPVAGSTISIYFGGSLAGVFAAMRGVQLLTGRAVVMTANAVAALGCGVVAFAPSWPFFLAGVLVMYPQLATCAPPPFWLARR